VTSAAVARAKAWFAQAESDARAAKALLAGPPPMAVDDVGCHVTALCTQAVEKSIKGYLFLNGQTRKMSHRADKYLKPLLSGGQLLRYKEHRGTLSALFDAEMRGIVHRLLDLTPGTLDDKDVANTEYPWTAPAGGYQVPAGATEFGNVGLLGDWAKAAARVSAELHKLGIAVDRLV
jgi:hypothetical protein